MQRFLRIQKTLTIKGKNDKLTLIKIKNVSLKDNVKKMKTWATHWEKIFTKYVLKKGICK